MSELPSAPWTELSLDFWGPTPDNTYALVLIDDYSRFPIVEFVTSTSSSAVIPVLDKLFSTFGTPDVVKTDNGPPFQGELFAKFASEIGFKHRKVTPLWPQANGEVERFMRNIGKVASTAKITGLNWKQEMFRFLRNYRATPHSSTQTAPASIMFPGRTVRIKIPVLHSSTLIPVPGEIRNNDQMAKTKMHDYKLRRNDQVLVKTKKQDKFSPKFDPHPYKITDINESMITASRPGKSITRNSSFFKKIPLVKIPDVSTERVILPRSSAMNAPEDSELVLPSTLISEPVNDIPDSVNAPQPIQDVCETPVIVPDDSSVRKSNRNRKKPQWLKDYF